MRYEISCLNTQLSGRGTAAVTLSKLTQQLIKHCKTARLNNELDESLVFKV
jgi:hypothetical protein